MTGHIEDRAEDHQGDVSMMSAADNSHVSLSVFNKPSALWTTYVQQMSPFYFNLLSELFVALTWR